MNQYCSTGYHGPYCSVCDSGYAPGFGKICHKCTASWRAGVLTIILVVLALLICVLWIVLSSPLEQTDAADSVLGTFEAEESVRSRVVSIVRAIPLKSFRIPIIAYQMICQYASITGIRFPSIYDNFLSHLNVFNIEIGWLLSASCLVNVNYYDRLIAVTVSPILFTALLRASFWYSRYKVNRKRAAAKQSGAFCGDLSAILAEKMQKTTQKHTSVFLCFTFLIYSTVSTTVFECYACDKFRDVGVSYLRADYSISCDTHTHALYTVYAGLMIAIYPIGIPLLYGILLWKQHRFVAKSRSEREDRVSFRIQATVERGSFLQTTRFLWEAYKDKWFWWEIVECFRRLSLTGFMVFILPNTSGQSAVACFISVASAILYSACLPHTNCLDEKNYILGCGVLFINTFLALVVSSNITETQDSAGQSVLAVLLITGNVCMLLLAFLQCVLAAMTINRARVESREKSQKMLARGSRRQFIVSGFTHEEGCVNVQEQEGPSSSLAGYA